MSLFPALCFHVDGDGTKMLFILFVSLGAIIELKYGYVLKVMLVLRVLCFKMCLMGSGLLRDCLDNLEVIP